jgi:peroxiredoxin
MSKKMTLKPIIHGLLCIFYITSFLHGQKPVQPASVPGGPTDIIINTTYPMLKTAKLVGFFADQNYIVDTIPAYTSKIRYTNPKGLNQGLYYIAFSDKEIIQVILDEDQQFEITVDFRNFLNTITVTGHDDTKLMFETAKFENSFQQEFTDALNVLKSSKPGTVEYNAAKEKKVTFEKKKQAYIDDMLRNNPTSLFARYKSGGQNPKLKEDLAEDKQVYHYRKEFWDMVDFSDIRLLYTPMIANKAKRYFGKEMTPQIPDSIIGATHNLIDKVIDHREYYKFFVNMLLFQYEPGKSSVMDAEAIFVDLTRSYVTLARAFWAEKSVIKTILQRADEMAQSRIGQPAPNVISFAPDGSSKELLASKAEYIIVYMYNPDCEHCQEQSPRLVDFYHKNRETVDVYAIALDTDPKKWTDYIAKVGMDWTNVYDPSNRSIYGKYYVDITPEIYVINKERKIIGKNIKVLQIQSVIDRDKKLRK